MMYLRPHKSSKRIGPLIKLRRRPNEAETIPGCGFEVSALLRLFTFLHSSALKSATSLLLPLQLLLETQKRAFSVPTIAARTQSLMLRLRRRPNKAETIPGCGLNLFTFLHSSALKSATSSLFPLRVRQSREKESTPPSHKQLARRAGG